MRFIIEAPIFENALRNIFNLNTLDNVSLKWERTYLETTTSVSGYELKKILFAINPGVYKILFDIDTSEDDLDEIYIERDRITEQLGEQLGLNAIINNSRLFMIGAPSKGLNDIGFSTTVYELIYSPNEMDE